MKRHLQCAEQPESPSNCTQILRLPRKMNLMIDPPHIWNVIYNAPSNKSHPPTSPNTAPATKFWVQDVSGKSLNCFRQYKDDSRMIRGWSEDNPTIKSSSRTRRFGDLTRPILETHFVWKKTFRAPAISQNFTKCCACHEKWHSNFTKYCTCHAKWISWLIRIRYETSFTMLRVTLQLHQILRLPRKVTLMMLLTYETSFTMRGATLVTVQHHQILRLPRNSEFKMSAENPWIASAYIKTIRRWSEDNPTIKSSSRTRRFGDLTRPILEAQFVLKNTTFRAPAISQNCTKCCACHEKWHSNFTKYWACHAKWISWLIRIRYETSLYNAPSHPPTAPKNCACHAKSLSW